jgi:transposase-like protein
MSRVRRRGRPVNGKAQGQARGVDFLLEVPVDTVFEMIQALIPLGLMAVGERLQADVRCLAGGRYRRGEGRPGHVRWGCQRGSVYLADQRVPMDVPRVRNRLTDREVPLETYARLQTPREADRGLLGRVLKGLSCRDYEACAEAVPEAFGLSASTVSRRFIRAGTQRLRELCERRLEGYDLVSLILDGKAFAEDSLVIGLGITLKGEKVVLGFVQTGTENERALSEFLRELVERGLRYEQGLLCVIDGSKGLRSAVGRVFGPQALIQRCQWHKRENVVSYLPKGQQARVRRKLQAAYEQPTYEGAKAALGKVRKELELMNRSAARSLEEGLEETLMLHRLGLFASLGVSLKTTNCLESIMALVGQRTDKVDRWRNSEQKQRWVAAALLDIEPRLRRIKGHRHLPRLRTALRSALGLPTLGKACEVA